MPGYLHKARMYIGESFNFALGTGQKFRAWDRSNIEAIGTGAGSTWGVARGLKEVLIRLVLILYLTLFKQGEMVKS